MRVGRWRLVGAVATAGLLIVGCSPSGLSGTEARVDPEPEPEIVYEPEPVPELEPELEPEPEPEPEPEAEPEPQPEPEPEPEPEIDGREAVRAATFRIDTTVNRWRAGSEEPVRGYGSGTGFLIDTGGIALTNHHVITGAGTMAAAFNDEADERPLEVIASSECYDLALVKVGGRDLPDPLVFHEGLLQAGDAVHAAGYPGGGTYAYTSGTVTRLDHVGEFSWASLPRSVEHTALTRGGNSGGPVVTDEGRVFAVNFAGPNPEVAGFAIPLDVVLGVLDDLREGTNVYWAGIAPEALGPDRLPEPGVWVEAVAAGSPADVAGVRPGDVIVELAGVDLGRSGTAEEYCGVLKSHAVDATIDLVVYRPEIDDFLDGQLNGRPLERRGGDAGDDESTDGGSIPASVWDFFAVLDDSCADGARSVDTGTDAAVIDAVSCSWGSVVAGEFISWAGADAMDNWFDGWVDSVSAGPTVTTWTTDGQMRGRYMSWVQDGGAVIIWTYDRERFSGLLVQTEADLDALETFWAREAASVK
jgi:S1-C subfamily serine protease